MNLSVISSEAGMQKLYDYKRSGEGMKLYSAFVALFSCLMLIFPYGAYAIHLPFSDRSLEAISRVKPLLENDLAAHGLKWGAPVYLRIFKKERLLEVWGNQTDRFILFRTYHVCNYGPNGLGPKLRQGDMAAPEGFYLVTASGMNPNSNFHLSFNIGYPNEHDEAQGWTGSAIMVHGKCKSWGCYALSDKDIEEVYALVDAGLRYGQPGVPVHIFPFKMTDENMKRYQGYIWKGFWENLKVGYDLFEQEGFRPPQAIVQNTKYVFSQSIQGGYDFDRSSIYDLDGHIKAVGWFVPDEKIYFRHYFDGDLFNLLEPYKEEYHLVIEPKSQEYAQNMLVVRDRYGRVLEVVIKEKTDWRPINSAPSAMRNMLDQVMMHHLKK
jgi:murein L,D-transpeptidase YafK